jgi:hypothetical protein
MARPLSDYRADRLRALRADRWQQLAAGSLGALGLALGLYVTSAGPDSGLQLPVLLAILAPAVFIVHRVKAAAASARADFYADWASAHDLIYTRRPDQQRDASILRRGRQQRFLEAFLGRRQAGDVEVANFRYVEGSGRSRRVIELLVARVDCPVAGVAHVSLEPRGRLSSGILDGIESAFSSDRAVELESSEFDARFRLRVDDQADDVAVRRLFTPKAITRLLDAGDVRFEIAGSALYVWESRHFNPRTLDRVEAILAQAVALRGAVSSDDTNSTIASSRQ